MAWGMVGDTISYNSHPITPLRTPLMFPQIPGLCGWLYFVFCSGLIVFVALLAIVRRDVDQAERLIGAKTLDEQVEEETVQ